MIIILLILTFAMGIRHKTQSITNTSFEAPSTDSTARWGTPVISKHLNYKEVDTGFYTCSLYSIVPVEEECAVLNFTNPDSNQTLLKLRIYNQKEQLLGETGVIHPGQYLEKVPLRQDATNEEELTIQVMGYQPETYHSDGTVYVHTKVK